MADSTMLGFFRSLGPVAVTVWRGSVEGGTGQQMKTCLTPCLPDSLGCPAAEDAKYENDAIPNLNQESSFFAPTPSSTALQVWAFNLTQNIRQAS